VFTFSPAILSYASVSVVAGGTSFPTIGAGPTYNFPKANCRQLVILNTGGTTLYFGSTYCDRWSAVPSPFNPASIGIAAVLGFNCTIIPAGGTLAIELDPFEKRGQFDPGSSAPWNQADFAPINLIFFSAPPATNATAQIMYLNTDGPF
jgi:hypothetical protein